MAEFKVFQGRNQLARYRFEGGDIRIGRHPDCEIQLTDPSVSRNHAQVTRQGDSWVLKISAARNGMFVNGNMVSFRVLKSGDRIEIAHFVIQFDDAAPPQPGDGDSDPQEVADWGPTTVALSLGDALKIHQINTQVMGAHVGWFGDGEDENIVSLKGERTLIGSTAECGVQLAPRPGCTGQCAAIINGPSGFTLEPLAESGSVKLNAVAVTGTTALRDGDRIMWGNYILAFREPVA